MDPILIRQIVEAALLAAPQPITLAQLAGLFPEEEQAPPGSIEQAIAELREACADRGVELVEVASGFRFQVKADVHAWVARLWTERQTKYTRATLETLALIAYRQPITRGEIEQIRGVSVNANMIKMLEEREWIRSVGHRDVPGRPELFGTTKTFLDYFGLKSLDQLPPLAELKDIAELDPQLPFDIPSGVARAALAPPLDDGIAVDDDGSGGAYDGDDEIAGDGHLISGNDSDTAGEGHLVSGNDSDTAGEGHLVGGESYQDNDGTVGTTTTPTTEEAGDTAGPEQKQ
jgi:segregation and condensation protein B